MVLREGALARGYRHYRRRDQLGKLTQLIPCASFHYTLPHVYYRRFSFEQRPYHVRHVLGIAGALMTADRPVVELLFAYLLGINVRGHLQHHRA